MKLTNIDGVGAVREHLLQQAGYLTAESVAIASIEDIQRAANVTFELAQKIRDKAQSLTVGRMNAPECEEAALKELEDAGLIKDRHGDYWTATDRGMIEHKKLMVLLGISK